MNKYPRVVNSLFGEDCKCDACGSGFGSDLWIWNEHTACSKTCVEKAFVVGEDIYNKTIKEQEK
jgi:hypothetical protein